MNLVCPEQQQQQPPPPPPPPPPQRDVPRHRDYQAKSIPIWDKVLVTAKTEDSDIGWMHAFCVEM